MVAAQLALAAAWVSRLFESKKLFVGETWQYHFQFPLTFDAVTQVLLHRGHGGKQFVAQLALVISIIFWSAVSSESGYLIS